ncbi:hypothetical protein ASG04_12610 [Curtobacterium sp. Leaf183]|uniref:MauE/DoxX family redox-associated membrane protein n=1 Tax=Curtobacterium sp. Leaf183 TaxID=1736291 RepID=UPI000700E866|nr:MauE/DoxX family redox-associated membrane protein [Curtobacterium sp. Leaf183]KQS07987.1 hypothetical protein ASG04_12610 [Curtobacterium sp. Leaf183]
MTVVTYCALLLIGGYMLISGVVKVRDGADITAGTIHAYKFIPPRLDRPAALLLAAAEVGAGALLISGRSPRLGATAVIALLATYTVALSSVLRRGIHTSCGCHGTLSTSEVRPVLMIRNVTLIAITAAAAALSPEATPSSFWATGAAIVLAAIAGVAMRYRRTATPIEGESNVHV